MNDFMKLQQNFQHYLQTGQADIQDSIVNTDFLSAKNRLQVYRDAYQIRLEEALTQNFPALQAYLGQEAFHQLALDYIAAHPSRYRSIRWFGDGLADYLKNDENTLLAELAEFEWSLTLVFDAADAPQFELSQMALIPPESWGTMILKAHPSLRRMNFSWNVVAIWEALSHHQTTQAPIKSPSIVPWVMWRQAYSNRFYALAQDEAWAIDAMQNQETFGAICEGLCQWHAEDAVGMRAATLLKGWIHSGLINDLVLNS